MAQIILTITVTEEPNVSVMTRARGVSEAQIKPMLRKAIAAVEAELAAVDDCPFHSRKASAA